MNTKNETTPRDEAEVERGKRSSAASCSAHTRGAWYSSLPGEAGEEPMIWGTDVASQDGYPVARLETEARSREEFMANARLIAAAPEMLELLEDLLKTTVRYGALLASQRMHIREVLEEIHQPNVQEHPRRESNQTNNHE